MTLDQLKIGEAGIITKVRGRGSVRKRVMEMVFVKGKAVKMIKTAPLRDPIEFQIMDYSISLRQAEAALIEVVPVGEFAVSAGPDSTSGRLHVTEKIRKELLESKKEIDVALVGNPNSGKTSIFNHASNSREHVGNYAGVTVDSKKAVFKQQDYKFNLTDLPGTYSITAYSPEELFVRKFLMEEHPDVVLNVIDAANLERNLYLTTQLIDMDMKVVIALNMYDDLNKKGDTFD